MGIQNLMLYCLSETYLDSSNLSDGDNFDLSGYNIVRADHSSNAKKGGVCIYFKNSSVKVLDIQFLEEFINFGIKIAEYKFISLCRSPSPNKD